MSDKPINSARIAFINAGSYVKAKVGGRSKSMKVIVAATFMVAPLEIELPDYDAIDRRSAVNKNVKARVMVVRPKWTDWQAEFELSVTEPTVTREMVEQIISYAGSYVGIGSYRPTCNGMFGRFQLEHISKSL